MEEADIRNIPSQLILLRQEKEKVKNSVKDELLELKKNLRDTMKEGLSEMKYFVREIIQEELKGIKEKLSISPLVEVEVKQEEKMCNLNTDGIDLNSLIIENERNVESTTEESLIVDIPFSEKNISNDEHFEKNSSIHPPDDMTENENRIDIETNLLSDNKQYIENFYLTSNDEVKIITDILKTEEENEILNKDNSFNYIENTRMLNSDISLADNPYPCILDVRTKYVDAKKKFLSQIVH